MLYNPPLNVKTQRAVRTFFISHPCFPGIFPSCRIVFHNAKWPQGLVRSAREIKLKLRTPKSCMGLMESPYLKRFVQIRKFEDKKYPK